MKTKIFLLSFRIKYQILHEIYMPILILLILVTLNYVFVNEHYNAQQYKDISFPPDLGNLKINSSYLYITPNDKKTTDFVNNSIWPRFPVHYPPRFFPNISSLKKKYASDAAAYKMNLVYGLEFDPNNFPFNYTIYTAWNDDLYSGSQVKLFDNYFNYCRKNMSSSIVKTAFENCAANKYVYDGLASLKYYTDLIIRQVSSINV